MVDACSFTELRRRYPRQNFPAVWELVEDLVTQGRLISVADIFVELDAQDDEVSSWAQSHQGIFLPLSEDIQTQARDILRSYPNLIDLKKRKSSADPFLIAAAIIHEATVVTQEKPSGGPQVVKIPDVCRGYRIPCIQLLEMLQEEGLMAS